tara:strand:- start:12213 stop:13010 length:798 start_codon:yes stop_codon:yes gene_type:complete
MNLSEINKYFPISSQTSNIDKYILLKTIDLIKKNTKKKFKYLEIGSFLGGSLTPFLLENQCGEVISIDRRRQRLDDERNEIWSYENVSEKDMLNKLKSFKIKTNKLKTFDGDVSEFKTKQKFDLVFIDGIHTDKNTFSDFINSYDKLKTNSIVLFHDSSIIFKSISIINILLSNKKSVFKLAKFKNSEITGIFFGKFSRSKIHKNISSVENFDKFSRFAQETLLLEQINNRIDIKFKISRFLKKKFPYKLSIKKIRSKNSSDFHK